MSDQTDLNNDLSPEAMKETVLKFEWAIRPCHLYKEEYKDCTGYRDRFHQYFVHGEFIDCTQWKKDYDDCERYVEKQDWQAALNIVRSEKQRRDARLKAHYANNVWTKRAEPPADWNKPLPPMLAKRQENTFLEVMKSEVSSETPKVPNSFCVIM